jgi:hypothetical protein
MRGACGIAEKETHAKFLFKNVQQMGRLENVN